MAMLDRWLLGDTLRSRILRFAIVGGVSTIAYGVVTLAAVEIVGLQPLLATVLGYLLVVPLNFVLQRTFTFRSSNDMASEIPRFLLVHGLNIAASFAVMLCVVNLLDADYRWGIAATMTLVPVLVFLALETWVFRQRRTD